MNVLDGMMPMTCSWQMDWYLVCKLQNVPVEDVAWSCQCVAKCNLHPSCCRLLHYVHLRTWEETRYCRLDLDRCSQNQGWRCSQNQGWLNKPDRLTKAGPGFQSLHSQHVWKSLIVWKLWRRQFRLNYAAWRMRLALSVFHNNDSGLRYFVPSSNVRTPRFAHGA